MAASISRKRVRTSSLKSSPQGDWDWEGDIPLSTFSPKLNEYEHGDGDQQLTMVTVTLGLPGVKREEVTVQLLHDEVTVLGQSVDQQTLDREKACKRRELSHGKFRRVLKVPLGLEPLDIKARMENGLLTLTYPKYAPNQKPHSIPIE